MSWRRDALRVLAVEFDLGRDLGPVGVGEPVTVRSLSWPDDHQALLVLRFDRAGDPIKPTRKLYASAHTAMLLPLDAVRGDPARSYINLADKLRVWVRLGPPNMRERIADELAEQWRRVAFNALVGNTDDHHLNTGLLCHGVVDKHPVWGLSPAFDITPNSSAAYPDGPPLAMATGADGHSGTGLPRLLDAAERLGLSRDEARAWLAKSAHTVAQGWEPMLREAAAPLMADAARSDQLAASVRPSFAYAERLAQQLR